jgi:hypothetical protein
MTGRTELHGVSVERGLENEGTEDRGTEHRQELEGYYARAELPAEEPVMGREKGSRSLGRRD